MTGANYLLDFETIKILVDCGLNQGSKYAEDLNYEPFGYDPKIIDYVLVTHSHIDHVGRLPKLYKEGFRGTVMTSEATKDLMAVALPDNMSHIAREANDAGREPLFDQHDLNGLMSLTRGVNYDIAHDLGNGISVTFHDAGHILGSSIIEILWPSKGQIKRIFFTGDLGNPPTPLLRPTEFVHDANYIVIESAYGDRVHEAREERKQKLADVIIDTINRKGVLMIPSFALERTQEMLFELNELHNKKTIPDVPIFIDSPLAIKMTDVYKKHVKDFNKAANYLIDSGDDVFRFPGLRMTPSVDESKAINDVPLPKIIIAGSGMSQGGRILHHEIRYLSDPNSTILFVGYQVDGSLGRRIQKGDKVVTIYRQKVEVKAHIETISSYSAHADQPALLHWIQIANTGKRLEKVFVVQGEETSAKTLANLVHERFAVEAVAPQTGDNFELD